MGGGLGGPALTASGRAVQLVARYADDAVRVGYGGVASAVGYVAQPFARPVGVKILATGPVEAFYEKIMSSGSSSERNGTHVGPGGNTPGVYVPKIAHTIRGGKIVTHQCSEGWHPRVHRHKNGDISLVCVPNKFKGKKIRFDEK